MVILACLLSVARTPGILHALQIKPAPALKLVPRVRVPRLLDHTEADAEKLLADSGLQVGKVNRKMSTAKPGTVLEQLPRPNGLVPRGSSVDITVAILRVGAQQRLCLPHRRRSRARSL